MPGAEYRSFIAFLRLKTTSILSLSIAHAQPETGTLLGQDTWLGCRLASRHVADGDTLADHSLALAWLLRRGRSFSQTF